MRETVNWQKAPLLVLVVGDGDGARRLMCYALGSTDYATEETADGTLPLSAYERWQLDIALLNVLMSGMGGSRRSDAWKIH